MGIAYQGKELQEGVWFPTIDVGMGDDKVKILQPPKNLIDDITWKEAEEFVSRTTMMNVKRLSQLSNLLQKQIDLGYCSQSQLYLFELIQNILLYQPHLSLDDILE